MTKKIKYSGKQAQERAAVKRGKLLRWLWMWGVSDRYIAGKLWGTAESSTYRTIANIKKLGLIAEVRISGMPTPALHLTPVGAELVKDLIAEKWQEIKPIIYPSRINANQVQHDLLIQRALLNLKDAKAFKNDRFYRRHGSNFFYKGGKIPDATLHIRDEIYALEIVENIPRPEEQRRLLWLYGEAYERNRLSGVIFGSTNPTLLKRLKKTAAGDCGAWSYNSAQRRWYEEPKEHRGGDLIDFVTEDFIQNGLFTIDLTEHKVSLYQVLIK